MNIITNNLILKKETENLIGTYYIYQINQGKLIGHITYNGYHFDKKRGDISYTINQTNTNKGYGKEALFKLIEILDENNIPDFWISCDRDNTISRHIINKYLDIEKIIELENIINYQCRTNIKQKKTPKKVYGNHIKT